MDTFNIQDAKTHLSRFVERAARGEPFVIDAPDDVDDHRRDEIASMFYGDTAA